MGVSLCQNNKKQKTNFPQTETNFPMNQNKETKHTTT